MLIQNAYYYTTVASSVIFTLDTDEGQRFLAITVNDQEEPLQYAITQSSNANEIRSPLMQTVIPDPGSYGFTDLYNDWKNPRQEFSHSGSYVFNEGRYESQFKEPAPIAPPKPFTSYTPAYIPTPPVSSYPYNRPVRSGLSGISMTVLGGFIALAGIAAIALAFTVLAAIPPASIALCFLGGAALGFGGTFFFAGLGRMFAEQKETTKYYEPSFPY
jgi:hypothetical protein